MISIIIRTKNEERWIGHCLKNIFNQSYDDFEVIIVDNESTDGTLKKAEKFPVNIVSIKNYRPGRSLNYGIKNSRGEILVFLSGHCIPVDDFWLKNLITEFDDNEVAAVYGRQKPMSFSSPQTKRDLLITFGLDRKIQIKDSFFHNANSAIRRSVWNKVQFDENITNIEDRLWATEIIKQGYKIIYTPASAVYHHHGIHHDNDKTRVQNTAQVIENHGLNDEGTIDIMDLSILCIIPVKGSYIKKYKDPSILKYTLEYSKSFDFIHETVVLTDSQDVSDYAKQFGAKVPFLREKSDSQEIVDLKMVYEKYYNKIENELDIHPDLIVSLEPTYLFRPDNLIEKMLALLLSGGYDSVLPVIKDYNWAWIKIGEKLNRVDSDLPRQIKEPLVYSLKGLGCVTHSEFIRNGEILGQNIGMIEVDKIYDQFEIRNPKIITQVVNAFSTLQELIII